ncbi:NitT/TauT family transport system substrate-binding protein [Ruminococcus sp. YE71]|nr:ABC transporter substrate-binding protein [Ruminococcus sp. YE78]SDA25938.1 NitT/TauT family transport system substrate-binding protein [Ruminococcus sp. YE78]SFW35624.1 NitT/TauT family transport system substrate-binding protein [Ruminococcus sp. YE71]
MKRSKKVLSLITALSMGLSFTACGGSSAKGSDGSSDKDSKAFKLGVSPMSGWYAWYGVEGTGIFEKNGVDVDIEFFPVYSDSLTAFNSGQLDGICIAASDAVAPYNEGIEFKIVLVNDNSAGADALVVHDDSITSVKDLKGKSVATELGTLEHMYLLKLLDDNGMTIDDINFVNMTINDAGPAFIAGSVDAAVLWEPTLSMAVEGGGKVLCSTETEPGLIPDTLAVRSEVLSSSSDDVQKIVDSWFEGVEKLNARDPEFMQAIYDGAEISKDEYEVMLDGVTIFDKPMNEKTFEQGNDYVSLPFTINKSAKFLYDVGMIDKLPEELGSILEDKYIKKK